VTINLLAVAITLVITWLVFIGIKESARANAIMVAVKVVILLMVAFIGLKFVQGANWVPFSPNGWKGVQAGAAIIFFAFIGFDAVSTTAEECRNPSRDMPRGIIWSLVICTLIYVLVAAVVTGMVKYTDLAGKADPLAYVFEHYNLGWLAGIIAFGAVIATTAALLVYQVGQPRIFMAMSRDGLLGPWFGRVNPRYGTPGNATWLTGAIVAIPAALGNIAEVVELTNIGTLFAFGLVCVSVLILRVVRPDVPRGFRVRWPWLVAPAGIIGCLWIARGLPTVTWVRFVVWMALGLLLYFAYGRRRSALSARASEARSS
jgi:APA family basic amino acid/polyamine antiporter